MSHQEAEHDIRGNRRLRQRCLRRTSVLICCRVAARSRLLSMPLLMRVLKDILAVGLSPNL